MPHTVRSAAANPAPPRASLPHHHRMGDIPSAIRMLGRPSARLAALAAIQHGVVARRQLHELGFSVAGIGRLVEAERLIRLHRGVYAVGHAQLRPQGHWLAAVLACGDGAALALRCAAALWGFHWIPSGRIDVLVPRGRRGPSTVRTFRPRVTDITIHQGISVTTPMRTLRDLKRVLSLDALENTAARAATCGVVTDEEAAAIVGHRAQLTRTQQERRFVRAVRAAGVVEPE